MKKSAEASPLITFLLAEKSVRGAILDGTRMVQEMQARHGIGATESQILGRALMVTALMASSLKGKDEIALRIDCSGPIKGLVTEATATGEVRGYLKQTPVPLPSFPNAPDVTNQLAPLWETGVLTITRYLEDGRQPFTGSVVLQSGDIALEVSNYYRCSEQLPTTIHLSLFFDGNGKTTGAGGVLLQAMPDTDQHLFAHLEQTTLTLPALGEALAQGQHVEPWMAEQFVDFQPMKVGEKAFQFQCRCNEEKMRLLLLHLPRIDLEEIRDNGPFPVQLTCHFCNRHYLFEQSALTQICQEKLTFA